MPTDKPKHPALEQLGARLRDLRLKAGYTNYEHFAYEVGLSRSLYGGYEKGADMRFSTLMRILDFHQISPAEFFGEGF